MTFVCVYVCLINYFSDSPWCIARRCRIGPGCLIVFDFETTQGKCEQITKNKSDPILSSKNAFFVTIAYELEKQSESRNSLTTFFTVKN